MVDLANADAPGVLLLQEVPVWSLGRLEEWSGMRRIRSSRGRRPAVGASAAWLTRQHTGLFRSRLARAGDGRARRPRPSVRGPRGSQVSEPGRERRVVQAVRVEGLGVVANTAPHADVGSARSVARPSWSGCERSSRALARPGEPRMIGGDLNIVQPALAGYEGGGDGIDHVLVAGIRAAPLQRLAARSAACRMASCCPTTHRWNGSLG